jgi:FkbM family methyltransferase
MVKKWLKKVFNKTGYKIIKKDFFQNHYHDNADSRYRKTGDLNPLEQLFYKYIDDDFFFIQIGANNGLRYDPIHHLLVREKQYIRGIAIEPVQEYFEDLQVTYKDFPQIKLLNTAIHNTKKEATIYKINPDLPDVLERFKGMSSFDVHNFTKDGIEESTIVTEKVPCIALMDLIASEKINQLHLLQIDAEGYDIEIVKSIDFTKIKPRVINFEHRWQYNLIQNTELFTLFKTLIDHGYQILLNGNDALAYLDES